MPLRPLRAADVAALSGWLPGVAAEAGCDRWAGVKALRATSTALLYGDDHAEAFVAYEMDAPLPGCARIDLLAVAAERRRLGSGSRAALALERKLARSTKRLYVRVPSRTGLALYFWLRLGYRPLTQREWPVVPEGGDAAVWMVRQLR
jgi:GNAT superfamily N-acetyltransferase